jgi:response regulator RpfG family c-di-GMP phosphodiesterase
MAKKTFTLPTRLYIAFSILLVVSLILILFFIHHVFNQRINSEMYLRMHNSGKTAMDLINQDLANLQLALKDTERQASSALTTFESPESLESFKEFCNDRKIDFLCLEPLPGETTPAVSLCDNQTSLCGTASQKELPARYASFGVENTSGQSFLEARVVSKTRNGFWRVGKVLSPEYLGSLQNLSGMDVFLIPQSKTSASLSTLPAPLAPFQGFSSLPAEAQNALEGFLVYSIKWRIQGQPYQFIFYPLIDLENNVSGTLGMGLSLQSLQAANRNTYMLSLLFILSVVMTFLAIGILTARSLLQPLVDLKNTVTEFLSENQDPDLQSRQNQIEIKDELSFLDESFKQITEKLRVSLRLLAKAQHAEKRAQRETLLRLAIAAEYKDQETASHILRLSRYSEIIARHLGLSEKEIEILRDASPMHDIGKIGIPDHILQKPGPLTPEEFEVMKNHPKIGAGIFKNAHTPLYEACRIIALTHHEKWNGGGYPQGLKGEAIPLFGRIVAVADVFDALTTQRYYKPAFPLDTTLKIMKEYTGTHFDPRVMKAFMEGLEEMKKILGFKEVDLTRIDPDVLKESFDERR